MTRYLQELAQVMRKQFLFAKIGLTFKRLRSNAVAFLGMTQPSLIKHVFPQKKSYKSFSNICCKNMH